jgi:hypothetical protein
MKRIFFPYISIQPIFNVSEGFTNNKDKESSDQISVVSVAVRTNQKRIFFSFLPPDN